MVIQALDGEEIDDAAMYPGLGVTRTIDDARDPRMEDGPGAHRARLQGDEQLATRQAIVAEAACGIAQRGNFGMGSRIALADRAVEAPSDNLSGPDHDGADRHLPKAFCRARQGNGLAHEEFVAETGAGFLAYSHSIVAGGLPEMSYTTRLMPRTSLMMRFDTLPSRLCGNSAQWAVMKSCVCTARSATTYS